jgi:hypothetical protein
MHQAVQTASAAVARRPVRHTPMASTQRQTCCERWRGIGRNKFGLQVAHLQGHADDDWATRGVGPYATAVVASVSVRNERRAMQAGCRVALFAAGTTVHATPCSRVRGPAATP